MGVLRRRISGLSPIRTSTRPGEQAILQGVETVDQASQQADAVRRALRRQGDDDHDRSLIVERLAWTPEQRLDANAAFLRFYLAVRPAGPLIHDE